MSPTHKNEIISIISALDSQKASGPNNIPIKILKLMKNDISDQLTVFFNLSFWCSSFRIILKTSKAHQFKKKTQNLNVTIIDLFPCYLILIKSLKG